MALYETLREEVHYALALQGAVVLETSYFFLRVFPWRENSGENDFGEGFERRRKTVGQGF